MRVLITGGAGYVGAALLRAALDWDITVLDNLATLRLLSLCDLPRPVRFIEGDVCDVELAPLVEGQEAVVHLAALTEAAGSLAPGQADRYYRVNATGTSLLAYACREANVPLVFLSTTSVYGPQPEGSVVDETLPWAQYAPASPYAESKYAAEHILRAFHGPAGTRYAILRCGTIYGWSPGWRNHTAVNRFCWQAAMGDPLTVWSGAWDARGPYLALPDLLLEVQRLVREGEYRNTTRNLVTGTHTVREVVEIVQQFVPDALVQEVPAPLPQRGYTVASVGHPAPFAPVARSRLREGIAHTLHHLRPDLSLARLARALRDDPAEDYPAEDIVIPMLVPTSFAV